MSSIESMKAYRILKKKDLPEVNGTGYMLSHNKTRARVMVIVNDDNNKVFNIGFRTPPRDDTGVPHIMEHSVLCGSRRFPVKDPFVELCKGSLNTFLNAMTYSDKTVYPVASLNRKDFHNLMHVYLDGVFYPNIYDRSEIMMQEGWHYEVDGETEELKINGVVYNEMKGVYSNPEQQLYRIIESSLLPDTPYGFESGGDPVHIPELTREAFLDFHRSYYHPSNSYIYLYGDMDAVAELDFIDREYLSHFDYKEINSEITEQKPFEKPVYVREHYSLSDADEEKDNTYLAYNFVIGSRISKKISVAFSVLEHALLTAPGAPLKKAIIDAGIGKDVFSSYDDGILQPTFSVIAKNANEADRDRFVQVIEDTLTKLVEDKINKKALQASINYFEFKHMEANFGRYPKGLMLGLNAFSTWLYDDDRALELFSMNEVYEELKTLINTDFFEGLIKTYILDNNHKSIITLAPKKGLNVSREEKEKEKLCAYKAALSREELDKICADAKHLLEYQDEPSTPEELKTIPLLTIGDIEKNARKLKNKISEIEMVKVVSHNIFTNGISYVNLNFDISDLASDKYPVAALLTEIFKYVDTEKYTYNELANEININTGGIGFATSVVNGKNVDEYYVHFLVNAKFFHDQVFKAMDLIEEILFTSKLDDKKRLKEIIGETRSGLKMDLVASGHLTAADRAISYVSPIGVVKELTEGIEYYRYLEKVDDNFDDMYPELVTSLKTVLGEILRRGGLTVNYTGNKEPEEILTGAVTHLSERLSTRPEFDDEKKNKPVILNEGFKTSSQVQYVATAGNFRKKGLEFTGALSVLQTIFSYDYLWLNVRVKGGAYGCMCAFTRSGNGYFTSYRDPNLMETYEVYKRAADYVRNFNADNRDMTKYIIGAISRQDAPLTPSAEGNFSFLSYLMGLTDDDLQRERDEILGADVEKIRCLAPYIQAVIDSKTICAIGDETKIEEAKASFNEVLSVF